MAHRPYGREEHNRAPILNALLDPFNVALLAVLLVVGLVTGVLPVLGPVAVLLYLAGAARTHSAEDAARRVLQRARAEHEPALGGVPRLDEDELTPGIAKLVRQARVRQQRIRTAVADNRDLPGAEIVAEVDGFVLALEGTARRAQSLADALRDTPPERVAARLQEVKGDPARRELAEALRTQLETSHRMHAQLVRFGDEMERVLVELDTIRSHVVSAGATQGAAKAQELAAEVRSLREQMGAVADGMSAAYEDAQ